MKVIAVTLGIVALLPLAGCRKRIAVDAEFPEERGAQPPAANALQWIERLDESDRFLGVDLADLYAELPPQEEWPPVIEHLRKDPEGAKRKDAQKLRFFADLLAGDTAEANTNDSFRDLLLVRKDSISQYQSEKIIRYLYMFSPDPVEATKWAKEHFPAQKADSEYHHNSSLTAIEELLKKNEIDAAIETLWKEVKDKKDADDRLQALGTLARLGRLLEKPDLAEKATAQMTDITFRMSADDVYGTYSFEPLLDSLVHRKDWETIRKIGNRFRASNRFGSSGFHALSLIATYHLDGQNGFLKELAQSASYGVNDAATYADLLNQSVVTGDVTVGELAVRTWQAEGQSELARKTLMPLLAMNGGQDPYYRLAIDLFPDTASEFFRSLLNYNPYEERPLIWLAEIELRAGKPDEAHKLIDQAIALDPSDGEQGKDTRMQAYDVLSRILRAEGNIEKADFFAKVTKSIRQGEAADDYLNVGLVDEAVRRYLDALGEFGDAYCLQSRLALTLMKMGRFDEAKVHFEKAFELMPVSFGPVESHCFGCEGIFQDEKVRTIALAVFRKIIDKQPDNPRVHYLVGMLLEKMKEPKEAANSYRRALELDPKYYNCAVHLHQLLLSDFSTIRQADAFLPQLVKISPYPELAKHFHSRTDLRQAWIEAQTPPPCPLKLGPLPLPFVPPAKKAGQDIHVTSSSSEAFNALDGWSPDELLRENELVEWIDNGW